MKKPLFHTIVHTKNRLVLTICIEYSKAIPHGNAYFHYNYMYSQSSVEDNAKGLDWLIAEGQMWCKSKEINVYSY